MRALTGYNGSSSVYVFSFCKCLLIVPAETYMSRCYGSIGKLQVFLRLLMPALAPVNFVCCFVSFCLLGIGGWFRTCGALLYCGLGFPREGVPKGRYRLSSRIGSQYHTISCTNCIARIYGYRCRIEWFRLKLVLLELLGQHVQVISGLQLSHRPSCVRRYRFEDDGRYLWKQWVLRQQGFEWRKQELLVEMQQELPSRRERTSS